MLKLIIALTCVGPYGEHMKICQGTERKKLHYFFIKMYLRFCFIIGVYVSTVYLFEIYAAFLDDFVLQYVLFNV